MTRDDFLVWLARIGGGALALAALLRLLFGAQWFSFYGVAAIVLATLPFLHRALKLRLPQVGRRRALAWAYSAPAGLLAAGQALYWNAFFSGDANLAVTLGTARHMLWTHTGRFIPILLMLLVLVWLVVFARCVGEDTAPAARSG